MGLMGSVAGVMRKCLGAPSGLSRRTRVEKCGCGAVIGVTTEQRASMITGASPGPSECPDSPFRPTNTVTGSRSRSPAGAGHTPQNHNSIPSITSWFEGFLPVFIGSRAEIDEIPRRETGLGLVLIDGDLCPS